MQFLKYTVRIEHPHPEYVLNSFADNGIVVIAPKISGETEIAFSTDKKGLLFVKQKCEKWNCSFSILRNSLEKNTVKQVRGRMVIISLFAVIIISLSIFNIFISEIRVSGNNTVDERRILSELAVLGVKTGVNRFKVDSEKLCIDMVLAVPELQWFAINFKGSRAEVTVKERTLKPKINDMSEPIMVYASKTGVISKMTVTSGNALFSAGDAVSEGEVLISGVMEGGFYGPRVVRALGEVYALTTYKESAVIPMKAYVRGEIEEKNLYFSTFLSKIPINFYFNSRILNSNCVIISEKNSISLPGGATIPVSFLKASRCCWSLLQTDLSEKSAKSKLEECLVASVISRINGEILSYRVTYSRNGDALQGTIIAQCEELISAERPFTENEFPIINTETETEQSG